MQARIVGTGMYLPSKVMTNHDLEALCDTDDEWIRKRTGISERHFAEDGEGTADIARPACEMALANAGLEAAELDLIICCTVTPHQAFPATASLLQGALGASRAAAWDVNAACSGFLCGLASAVMFVEHGMYRNVLVVGAECTKHLLIWENRDTSVLFGDGAGAVVLTASDDGRGILSMNLGSDGANHEILHMPAGGSKLPFTVERLETKDYKIEMNGQELFKRAVVKFVECGQAALDAAGIGIDDVALFVPHQANIRIIEAAAQRMGIPMDRVMVNIDHTGNTVAATIPTALHEAVEGGRVKDGDYVLLAAFGAGLSWGAVLMRW